MEGAPPLRTEEQKNRTDYAWPGVRQSGQGRRIRKSVLGLSRKQPQGRWGRSLTGLAAGPFHNPGLFPTSSLTVAKPEVKTCLAQILDVLSLMANHGS